MAYTVVRGEQAEKKAADKIREGESRSNMEESPEIPGKTGIAGDKASLKRREDEEENETGAGDRKIGSDQSEEVKNEAGREESKGTKETAGKAERVKATRRNGRYRKKAENGSISERKYRRRSDKKERS